MAAIHAAVKRQSRLMKLSWRKAGTAMAVSTGWADSYEHKALRGFLKILLGRAFPGATVAEMQGALGSLSSGLGEEAFNALRRRFGIGEWFTCPLCGEVRAGDLGLPAGQVPRVELCLVCGGVFYAVPGSEEAKERLRS